MSTRGDFWDCECEKNYIHPAFIRHCPKCDKDADDMPDSICSEVMQAFPDSICVGQLFGLPVWMSVYEDHVSYWLSNSIGNEIQQLRIEEK